MLVDQACLTIQRAVHAAGLPFAIDRRAGLLDQKKAVQVRRRFVKRAYKFIRQIHRQMPPRGLKRYWIALSAIYPDAIVQAAGLNPKLFEKIRDHHQRRRRRLGPDSYELGWIDLSRNLMSDESIVWSVHVHSVVGVYADTFENAKNAVTAAYRTSHKGLHLRQTFMGIDFVTPDHSLAGWLAYATRSARAVMNIQRDKRVEGPRDRPKKNKLRSTQVADLIPCFSQMTPNDRYVLGNCRMGKTAIRPSGSISPERPSMSPLN